MMKTPLSEILKRVTPLLPITINHCRVPLGDTGEYDDRIDIIAADSKCLVSNWNSDYDDDARMNYLAHAANNFPALVEALEKMISTCERLADQQSAQDNWWHDSHQQSKQAIKSAQQVEGV